MQNLLFTLLLLLLSSFNVHAAGFEGGMLVLDPNTMSTSTGENNDVPVSGSLVYVSTTTSGDSITGFDPGQMRGNFLLVGNSTNNLIIKNNSSSSLATNRILMPDGNNLNVPVGYTAIFGYDAASQRWYELRTPPRPLNYYQSSILNPTGTSSATGVMMGLAAAITPNSTGRIEVKVCGDIANATALLNSGAQTQIRYGTGTAPTNGVALTGTSAGPLLQNINPYLLGVTPGVSPFSINYIITGLTVGTTYWIDLSLARLNGGTATESNISLGITEI